MNFLCEATSEEEEGRRGLVNSKGSIDSYVRISTDLKRKASKNRQGVLLGTFCFRIGNKRHLTKMPTPRKFVLSPEFGGAGRFEHEHEQQRKTKQRE